MLNVLIYWKGTKNLMEIKFTVLGKPFGKQRPRFSRRGRYTTTYTPQKTMDYEERVKYECIENMRDSNFTGWHSDEPLQMRIDAYYEIPKSYSKQKVRMIETGVLLATKKPDWDNIGKIIADSLNGILYKDDAQIVIGSVYKHYSNSPRVEVIVGDIEIKEK